MRCAVSSILLTVSGKFGIFNSLTYTQKEEKATAAAGGSELVESKPFWPTDDPATYIRFCSIFPGVGVPTLPQNNFVIMWLSAFTGSKKYGKKCGIWNHRKKYGKKYSKKYIKKYGKNTVKSTAKSTAKRRQNNGLPCPSMECPVLISIYILI